MEEPLILDRYRPLADLGSGGHGSVVLAFDTKMARRVAIKRLPLPSSYTPQGSKTGLAEARTAAMLNHANIVTVHEWDTDSDEAFIVMEDLDGASLADLLDETGEPFTLDETAAIVGSIASALSYAHANGVLHLDIKPANVLVTREGAVKVADFGVSALTDSRGMAAGTSGTIGYMPPEQLRDEPLDERTDCWAFAALAYELLTNANPFDADTREGSLFKIEIAEVPAPSDFEKRLSPGLDDVLLAALAPDPDERYATVREFSQALLPYLGSAEEGKASLRELVAGSLEDAEEIALPPLGVWDHLAPYAEAILRTSSALVAAWLVWSGLSAFDLGLVPLLVATGLAALGAALAPALGLALGLLAFTAGLVAVNGLAAGAIFGVLAALFWALRGRVGRGDALAPAFAPLLAVIRSGPALPLLAGFLFPPLPAAIAGGFGALAVMAASASAGGALPYAAVPQRFLFDPLGGAAATFGLRPHLLVVPVAWAVAAALCSVASGRASRAGAIVGVLLGLTVIGVGYGALAALSGASFSAEAIAIDLSASAILMAVVVAMGAPTRAEEE